MPKVGTREWNALLIKLEYNNDLVTSLSFHGDDIGNEGTITISKLLEENYRVTSLQLSNNKVGDAGAQALAKMLEENNTLTELKLDSNEISAEGVNAIGRALQKNKKLQILILGFNKIGENIEFLGQGLEKNRGLKTLELNSNGIGSKGAEIVASALEENETLNTLNLSNNQIGNAGAIALGKCLEKNKALIVLKLFTNQITTEGMNALFLSLEENQTLKTLDLDNNKVDVENAKILAKSLGKNKTLASLSLNKNQINTESLQFLAAGLENCALTFLSLRGNQIDKTGAEHLSKVLKKNEMLKQLKLADNQIGDESVEILCQALEENYTLTHLSLDNNQITLKGAQRLIQMFQKNHFLVSLELGAESPHNSNKIEQSEKQQIEALLKRNLSFKPGNVSNVSLAKKEEIAQVEVKSPSKEVKKENKQTVVSIPNVCKKIIENNLEKFDLTEVVVPDYWDQQIKHYARPFSEESGLADTTIYKTSPLGPVLRGTRKGVLYTDSSNTNFICVPGKPKITAVVALSSRFIASGCENGIIHIWDLNHLQRSGLGMGSTYYVKEIRSPQLSQTQFCQIVALDVLSDGQLVSLSSSNKYVLEIFDVWSGKNTTNLELSFWIVASLKIYGHLAFVAGAEGEGWKKTNKHLITVFDLQQKKHITNLEGHEDYITALELLPGGRLASGDKKGVVRIWQLNELKCTHNLTHENEIGSLAALPSGELAVGTFSDADVDRTAPYLAGSMLTYQTEHKHVGHISYTTTTPKVVNVTRYRDVKRKENVPALTIWNLDTLKNKTFIFKEAASGSSNEPIFSIGVFNHGSLTCYAGLRELSLYNTAYRNLSSEELKILLRALMNSRSVAALYLSGVQLNESTITTLAEVIQNNKFLEKIDLTGTNIEITGGGLKLLEALKNNYSISEITLDDNKQTEKLSSQFKEFLNRNKANKTNVNSQSGFFKDPQQNIKNKALAIVEKAVSEYGKAAETKKSTHLGRAFSIFCFRFHFANIKNDNTKNIQDIENLIDLATKNMIDQKEFGSRGYEKSGFYLNLKKAKEELIKLTQGTQEIREEKKETAEIFSA